jgi:hypothetical protein
LEKNRLSPTNVAPPSPSQGDAGFRITRDNNSTRDNLSESDVRNRNRGDSISNSNSRNSNTNLDEETVPTRSYFEDEEDSARESLRGSGSRVGGRASDETRDERKPNGKKAPISMSIGRPRTEPLDKTKTNDDNTIIDESWKSNSGEGGGVSAPNGKRYSTMSKPVDGEETGPKSIDGFPSGYSDADRLSRQSLLSSVSFFSVYSYTSFYSPDVPKL